MRKLLALLLIWLHGMNLSRRKCDIVEIMRLQTVLLIILSQKFRSVSLLRQESRKPLEDN